MELNEGVSELIGALIGDGYIYRKNRKYQIGYVGSPITDKEYFEKIKILIAQEWNKDVKVRFRERGLRIVFNSKELCSFLIEGLGIPHGEGKCERVKIPNKIASDWSLAKYAIRGIFDTDGSVFVAKKPGIEKYPSIELTTTSKGLAFQVRDLLIKQGFRVANIWQSKSISSTRIAYRVPLNGKNNIKMWVDKIGFSNPYKMQRALDYIKN